MGKPSKLIDLRSDTVTLPTDEMREAIRHAELGDDVFREDPTVNTLEETAAELLGKDAALLVTSGTQANLVSLISNTKRGDMVLLEAESHIYWYEVGAISVVAGLLPWPIRSTSGALDPRRIQAALRPANIHFPDTTLICIENTHNRHGGTVITPRQIEAISEVAKTHGLKLYMDGARIFNAAVAQKINVKRLSKHVDNLMFCLSKGLSCPVGSIIVGDNEFIEKARKTRKTLGGGMRQAGVIAAPGIIALEKMITRLEDDHRNARILAEGLAKTPDIKLELDHVQTNIVYFNIYALGITSTQFVSKLKEQGILALTLDESTVRMVTHLGIEKSHIEETLAVIEGIIRNP
ncbi:MAG: aminotransferase class I/II-fold pyridoxal phosphate-dependent enzyme [Candidatus Bathyarchaeota archaeon]|nr:MAG: aminotransferase class I/II-fold pyridoxal phosphate-dependent enzyme [Candidatus Bathyarchaeota archaeon]